MKTAILNTGITKAFIFSSIVLFSACSNNAPVNPQQDTDTLALTEEQPKNENGFYDIPQPIQQVQLLQEAGASYDKSILNPLDNVSKYTVTNSKALNLGVYGADLSYAAVFNHPQDVILYLSASQKLAESLGIKSDFYTDVMNRMEKNSGNKDSLMQIVSSVYNRSNEALKENDQSHISALVVAGSFIEAMYIGTQVAKNVSNKTAIYERIGGFRSSLKNLVALMATVSDSDFSNMLSDLKSIKAVYDESPGASLTEEQMEKITKLTKAIRIRITNL